MSLKIKLRHRPNTDVMIISGSVAGHDAVAIKDKADTLNTTTGLPVAVDLSGVEFIDSHGLGVLVYIWKRFESQKRELVIVNPSEMVREILVSTNLEKIIRVIDSTDIL